MIEQQDLVINTAGRGMRELTAEVSAIVRQSAIRIGTCHVFLHHTSASLLITENADPDVRHDLETYLSGLVQDGDPAYRHRMEGADDMAAHIRSVITQTEISLPVSDGSIRLGTWQGLYLWEHRYQPHRRQLTITVSGE